MLQTIESVLWFVALITGIWFMVSKKKGIIAEQPSEEPLSGKEKLFVFILCLVNPILIGAILYYGWKMKLPKKAKTANLLSFAAFAIFLIIYFAQGYLLVKKVGVENVKNLGVGLNQIKDFDAQMSAIASKNDPEDLADIQALQEKVPIGYEKADQWQPDAKFYSFRRIFTVPSGYSEQLLKNIDSYYYQSKNTRDNFEILFDRKSNNITRTDINSNRLPNYITNFTDLTTIKIGPKKALEIAMLSPSFQKYKKDNPECVTQVILNAEDLQDEKSINKFWVVTLYKGFGSPITPENSVIAYVQINTGVAFLPEVGDFLKQYRETENKLK